MSSFQPHPRSRARGLLAVGLLLAAAACDAARPVGPRPNIVIVLVDTLRADRLALYGHDLETSPNIDALAQSGVTFAQAHSAAPWTLPSVVSLFTSRFIAEHNVASDGQKISDSLMTLTEGLADSGYTTASFLKNPYAGELSGLDRGFDMVEPRRGKGQTTGQRVKEWLRNAPAGPHFVYVHNSQPHDPLLNRRSFINHFGEISDPEREAIKQSVKSYRALTRADFVKKRPLGTTDNSERQDRAMQQLTDLEEPIQRAYSGSVLDADARIGEIIQALREEGLWDNTLFMVIADHGEEMNDHGGWQHDQSLYQELIHVPFVVRFPHDEHAGARIEEPVSLVDVLPTILGYIGREDLAQGASGRNLLPLIESGPPQGEQEMRVVAMRHNMKKFYRAYKETRGDLNLVVRKGKWKAILNLELDDVELYDIDADPGERNDLSRSETQLAEEMKSFGIAQLQEFQRRSVASSGGGLEGADAATIEALEALGYVGGDPPQED